MKMAPRKIYWTIFLCIVVLSACDKISQPLQSKIINSTLPNTPPNFRDSSATSGPSSYKNYKVLVEDCMGHLCSNCPPAVFVGDSLIAPTATYPGQVIVMEENMGDFAKAGTVAGYPPYAFAVDYTCLAGNTWHNQFQSIEALGYPAGLIDRRFGPANIYYLNWDNTINDTLIPNNSTPSIEINIHDSCWTLQKIIGVKIQVTDVRPLSGNYSLEVVIIEDSIVDWQKDGLKASGYDSLFLHRNVLRGAFGNNMGGLPFGSAIPPSVTSTSDSSWISYQTYDFTKGENGRAAGWNMERCRIVAFVFNEATYQVVQAEMIGVE